MQTEMEEILPPKLTKNRKKIHIRHVLPYGNKKISLKNKSLSDIFFDVYLLASRIRLQKKLNGFVL